MNGLDIVQSTIICFVQSKRYEFVESFQEGFMQFTINDFVAICLILVLLFFFFSWLNRCVTVFVMTWMCYIQRTTMGDSHQYQKGKEV